MFDLSLDMLTAVMGRTIFNNSHVYFEIKISTDKDIQFRNCVRHCSINFLSDRLVLAELAGQLQSYNGHNIALLQQFD